MQEEADKSKQAESPIDDQQLTVALFGIKESTRSIEHQSNELTQLRARSMTNLGYASALVTFASSVILSQDPDKTSEFYAWMIAITVLVLLSGGYTRKINGFVRWHQKVSAPVIVEHYANRITDGSLRDLARMYQGYMENNEVQLEVMRRHFRRLLQLLAALALVVVMAMWRLA